MKRKSTIRKIASPIARDMYRIANSLHHCEMAIQKLAEQIQIQYVELVGFRNGQKQLANLENLEAHIDALLDAKEIINENAEFSDGKDLSVSE